MDRINNNLNTSSSNNSSNRNRLLNRIAHRVSTQDRTTENHLLATLRAIPSNDSSASTSMRLRSQELGTNPAFLHEAINLVTVSPESSAATSSASEGELLELARLMHTLVTGSRSTIPEGVWQAAINAQNDPDAFIAALLRYHRHQ